VAQVVKNSEPQRLCIPLEEAAAMIGCSVKSLRKVIWAGKLQAMRLPGGRRLFIPVDALHDFVRRNTTTEGCR